MINIKDKLSQISSIRRLKNEKFKNDRCRNVCGYGGNVDEYKCIYLKYLSGTKTFSTTQLEIADVNYDGYKDMRDVVAIMKIADKA